MMCYDERALYFAVRAEEPEMKAVADLLEKSIKGPWGTDLIEMFIDLNHDRNTYYHFAANAKGERWAARHTTKRVFQGRPSSWRCEWEAAGRLGAGGWTLEVAIPYTCFDLHSGVKVGPVIGVNVCREDPRSKEHSSWAFSHGAFHTPQAFGEVKGFEADLAAYRFEMSGLKWRRGMATASLANYTGKGQAVKVEFVADGQRGETLRTAAHGTCKEGAVATLSAPVALHADGNYAVYARVVDETGVARFVSQPVEVRVSGASALDVVGTEFDFYTQKEAARARCFVELSEERCEQCMLSWSVLRDDKPMGKPSRVRPEPGANEWDVPLADLSNRPYALRIALLEAGKEIAAGSRRFRKLPPAKHEVRINQWGRFLVCDGEPLLWYGFYDSLSRGEDQRWVDALKLMKSAHCNAVLNYVGGRAEHEKVGWALDQAHAQGLKVWVHLGWMLSYWIPKYANRRGRYESEEEALEALRTQVNRHKTHPALLGWCTLDEPGNRPTMFTRDYTERYYRLIKTLDPHHPCIFSHLTRLGETKVYGQATDLALMPFLARGGRYDSLFWEFWDAGLPVATNSPCYGALSGTCREPTPEEQRVRMYKALILGARGLCSYTFRCAAMDTWREFGRVGEELRTLAPILLTPDDRLRVEVSPGAPDVFALLKAHEDDHYLIAVNTATRPVEATFTLVDGPTIRRAISLFGEGEAIRVDGESRSITYPMGPQSSRVLRIE